MNASDQKQSGIQFENYRHWQLEIDSEGIGWLALDMADAKINVLSRDVLIELEGIIGELTARPPNGLIILSSKETGFIAGADINEFPKMKSGNDAYDLMQRAHKMLGQLESLPCPTVAAIDGFALGGGLELALACRWRVAVDEDRPTLGLPEVQLGLHPGFGGTVRIMRLLGPSQAMPMMLTGKSITPGKALKTGLIDQLASRENWRQMARALAGKSAQRRRPSIVNRILNLAPARAVLGRQMRQTIRKRAIKAP